MLSIRTAFGLAFDVEKNPNSRSGFAPADEDLGAKLPLFAALRLLGFASMLRVIPDATLVLIGGDEGRYPEELPKINRAAAIRDMLVGNHLADANRIVSIPSNSNTGGNVQIIAEFVRDRGLDLNECALVTNHYHLPRAYFDLYAAGIPMLLLPAEAFRLMEGGRKQLIINLLGEGPLAQRMAEEIQGIASKILGNYQPRTDTKAS